MFPDNTSIPVYLLSNTLSLADYDTLISQAFLLFDGFFKLTPPLVYPFLAGVLILELKIAQKRRQKLRNSSTDNSDKDTDNTTSVVVWMTIFYFIAEAPIGTTYILQFIFFSDMGMM